MIEHSKKKFIGNIKVDFDIDKIESVKNYPKKAQKIDFEKYNKAYFQIEDKIIIQAFVHLVNNKPLIIPEPEPSILYFINAENKLFDIIKLQSAILNYDLNDDNFGELSSIFYAFFQLSSDYIINLFTSIEAFNNGLIPDDFSEKIKGKNYNKRRAQRSIGFQLKMERVIPIIMKKSYLKKYPKNYQFILDIKKLRDNVVHTKNMNDGFPACYRELYVSYLEFDFRKSYEVIRQYFNFYKKNWIEKCNCSE